ncbi:Eukaryotic translation initiation factor 2 alpha kinase 4 [Caligus rogercresseyi]|uniref:Eukaryotic translation initiation factor 2 alpha kinase 4 n=1 Tax=Caligus rogercresseyi TaxID=217165 RepID=A0A7T8QV86_CALRO|nr:Eukaryotic translation initiation factor 2 alpha kinase 4 [Caligus rogercresseyi]
MERSKRLLNIGLSDQVISSLSKFLEREGSIQEISSHFRHITKRSNEAGANVKKAVQELQAIISLCHSFGVECELVIAPSLVYNPGHFSGMFCHVVKKKPNYHKTKQCDVIAAGDATTDSQRILLRHEPLPGFFCHTSELQLLRRGDIHFHGQNHAARG